MWKCLRLEMRNQLKSLLGGSSQQEDLRQSEQNDNGERETGGVTSGTRTKPLQDVGYIFINVFRTFGFVQSIDREIDGPSSKQLLLSDFDGDHGRTRYRCYRTHLR